MSRLTDRARELRATIETMAEGLSDETASLNVELFPEWDGNGRQYKAGDRVRYAGILYKVLQDHQAQPGWMPEGAPSLFAEVLPGQEGTDIGEWKQPDSTNPYMKGDKVTHNGKTWESTCDNNVWEPGVYGWQEV